MGSGDPNVAYWRSLDSLQLMIIASVKVKHAQLPVHRHQGACTEPQVLLFDGFGVTVTPILVASMKTRKQRFLPSFERLGAI